MYDPYLRPKFYEDESSYECSVEKNGPNKTHMKKMGATSQQLYNCLGAILVRAITAL